MRNKPNPESKSLTGVRVLVGRAKHQAGALSAELRKRGAKVLEIPFIEIRKPKSFKPLDAALSSLRTYDWLILTSVNGVEAMWERMETRREGHDFSFKPALSGQSEPKGAVKMSKSNLASVAGDLLLRVAAIGPATKKAIEQRGVKVDVVPKEYVAESVVKSLQRRVRGKRVLLVRAKVARDVIPTELRKAGAQVDVVEAYETVVPQSSRARLRAALKNPKKRPDVVAFTSSSTVKNFVDLLGSTKKSHHKNLEGVGMASIGPVTSATLRELGLPVDIAAKKFTIPGLIAAIVQSIATRPS
ncbi:MAG TPA: uroporphyrinogen-III synthase [Candidatus Sulfotelmatobacter sp.]